MFFDLEGEDQIRERARAAAEKAALADCAEGDHDFVDGECFVCGLVNEPRDDDRLRPYAENE